MGLLHQFDATYSTHPMVPYVVSMDIGRYNNFHRPDEDMLFVIVKCCLSLKNHSFT